MEIPVYDITINENEDDRTGVNLVSFVSFPAIESDFVALSEKKDTRPIHLNEDKQILTGAALIPDLDILRIDADGSPYFIRFSRRVIEQIRDKYHRLNKTQETNDEHETELTGNYLIESWLVSDPKTDKAAALGLGELPAGTWVLSFKVPNTEYWQENIKSGIRSGFSIEGFFNLELIESEIQKQKENKMTVAEKFFNVVKEFFSKNHDGKQEIKFEGEPCEDCPANDGEELGANGGRWLSDRINEMVTDEMTRGDIIARVASAAGVDESTINQIIAGEINCPPVDRLQAFADVMGVMVETVIEQFAADGCEYGAEEENKNDETEAADEGGVKVEQSEELETDGDEWEKLEKAAAEVEKLQAEHKAEIEKLNATISELNAKIEALEAAPAAEPIDTTPKPETQTQTKHARMMAALKRVNSYK